MKTTGIVCEYNPLTNGHLYHLQKAREETGADTVVCVMSGSFTQRAEAAVADKYLRAEVAVRSGADMVVELPVIYAVSPGKLCLRRDKNSFLYPRAGMYQLRERMRRCLADTKSGGIAFQ